MKALFAILVACLSMKACADDIPIGDVAVQGETLKNARITSHTEAYAVVMFDGGGKKVLIRDLPENVRRDIGYDLTRESQELAGEARAKQKPKASLPPESSAPAYTVALYAIPTSRFYANRFVWKVTKVPPVR